MTGTRSRTIGAAALLMALLVEPGRHGSSLGYVWFLSLSLEPPLVLVSMAALIPAAAVAQPVAPQEHHVDRHRGAAEGGGGKFRAILLQSRFATRHMENLRNLVGEDHDRVPEDAGRRRHRVCHNPLPKQQDQPADANGADH